MLGLFMFAFLKPKHIQYFDSLNSNVLLYNLLKNRNYLSTVFLNSTCLFSIRRYSRFSFESIIDVFFGGFCQVQLHVISYGKCICSLLRDIFWCKFR